MQTVIGYHRPETLDDAVRLLSSGERVPLAGGTALAVDAGRPGRHPTPVEVVDLQALGLDRIEADGTGLRLGAMVRLQALVDHDGVPAVVGRAARAELPSALRSLATVGGSVASRRPDSVLVATLLVHDATVALADGRRLALADLLQTALGPGDLIVSVTIDGSGRGALSATGRTPADLPIVAAVARTTPGGEMRLALTGVADVPVVAAAEAIDELNPPGDFRGSPHYRRHLARVLSERVRRELS